MRNWFSKRYNGEDEGFNGDYFVFFRAVEIWGTWDELKKEKRRRGQQNEEYLDGKKLME